MSEIRLENLRKSFDGHEVIGGIDLSVAEGEYCVFLGPSGCGKSTLLRLIAGLEQVDSGSIHIGDRDVTRLAPKQRNVAMVFQSYALYPHMTVYENMAFGLRLARRAQGEVERRVRCTAESLHIAELLQRKPAQLSGGQRQRVAIGRAIVREPAVFLLDEPLSNLDAELRVRMRFELSRLHRRLGTTTIHVTHDQGEAMTLADRLVVIDNGRVAQSGPPLELYHRPHHRFVAGFLGSPRMNLLPGRVQRIEASQATLALAGGTPIQIPMGPAGITEGAEVTLGIRPEHLLPGPGHPNSIRGTVALVEHLGDHALAYLEWQEDAPPLVLRLGTEKLPTVGETLSVGFPGGHCHLFDRDGAALLVRES